MRMFGLIVGLISASITQDVHLMDRLTERLERPSCFFHRDHDRTVIIDSFLFSTSIIRSGTDRAA